MAVLLALLSSVFLGGADFVGGLAARRAPAIVVVAWSNAVGLGAALLVLVFLPARPSFNDLGWGLLAGVCGSFGVVLLYRALAVGVMSVVAPVSAAAAAVIPVGAGAVIGEHLTAPGLVGVGCALAAVVLLGRSGPPSPAVGPRTPATHGLVAAMLAGVSFGLFLTVLSRTSGETGLWPLVAARCASLVIVIGVVLVRRESLRLTRAPGRLAVGAGLLDMTANTAFLVAIGSGQLTVVGVLASLSPLGTVLLARVMLRERLRAVQRVGTALAISSVVLLTLH